MERERSSAQGWYAVSIVLAGAFMANSDKLSARLLLALASRALLTAPASVPDERVRSS